jgi:hypothetical protein
LTVIKPYYKNNSSEPVQDAPENTPENAPENAQKDAQKENHD